MDQAGVELRAVRAELHRVLGRSAIASFHRANPLYDAISVLGVFIVFGLLFLALSRLHNGVAWLACFFAQGVVLTLMGLINHDLFVHRKSGGQRFAWYMSVALTMPLMLKTTGYSDAHLAHHRNIGKSEDTEIYKQDLNTRLRRLAFCTVFGISRAIRGRFADVPRRYYLDVRSNNPMLLRRVKIENNIRLVFLTFLAGTAVIWPRQVLLGYIGPGVIMVPIMVPILNTFRIIIEHADLNPSNAFHLATFYKTGFISRVIFLWDSGDCHLIHHIYPNIPFYRISAALRLMRPILLSHGVVERPFYRELLVGWFLRNYAHRTLWPLSEGLASRM